MDTHCNDLIDTRHLTSAQRRELIIKLLKESPEKSNRSIAVLAQASHMRVGAIRLALESSGELRETPYRTSIHGVRKSSSPFATTYQQPTHVHRGKSQAERIAEIESLIAAGHNVGQVAEMIGIDVKTVRALIHKHKIPVTTQTLTVKGRNSMQPERIIEQTVYSLSGLAQGLRVIRNQPLSVSQEQAIALLDEARTAISTINGVLSKLREIANG